MSWSLSAAVNSFVTGYRSDTAIVIVATIVLVCVLIPWLILIVLDIVAVILSLSKSQSQPYCAMPGHCPRFLHFSNVCRQFMSRSLSHAVHSCVTGFTKGRDEVSISRARLLCLQVRENLRVVR